MCKYFTALIAVPALFVIADIAYSGVDGDVDNDGVPDSQDLDHDNDGITNWLEGYRLVSDPAVLPVKKYLAQPVEFAAIQTGQSQGSSYRYQLLDTVHSDIKYFQGTLESGTTTVNWSSHNSLPKLQLETPGIVLVRWLLTEADNVGRESIDIDLTISDLDAERSESITVKGGSIVGYSVATSSGIEVSTSVSGQITFTQAARQAASDLSQGLSGAVTLHIREQQDFVVEYSSRANNEVVAGLNNHRAGFRHDFTAAPLTVYYSIAGQRDTDSDGIPDHRDLDSDNDSISDVIEAAGTDLNLDDHADGEVSSGGIPLSAGNGLIAPDSNKNGVADPYEFTSSPVIPTAENVLVPTSVQPDIESDTDGDGLTNTQEQQLGTNPDNPDTDGDGVTDSEEVIIFHTDPLVPQTQNQQPHIATVVAPVDSDNDGIADVVETLLDNDNDGVPNQYDLDSDNDGIADIIESGMNDSNADGQLDLASTTLIENSDDLPDFDLDGVANMYDLDSDQDGLYDLVEVRGNDLDDNGVVDTFNDSNVDGWSDGYHGMHYVVIDKDNNGEADYLDPLVVATIVQNDELANPPADTTQPALHTGLRGGGGCVFRPLTQGRVFTDPSLAGLLILAIIGIRRRTTSVVGV